MSLWHVRLNMIVLAELDHRLRLERGRPDEARIATLRQHWWDAFAEFQAQPEAAERRTAVPIEDPA